MLRKYPSLRAFISYISEFKKTFWITALFFALANVVITLVPWLIGHLTGGLTSRSHHEIMLRTTILIVASITHDLLWRLGEMCFARWLVTLSYRFDDIVFSSVLESSYSYFVDNFTGKVSSYANRLGSDFR
jgi:ATP-binding cassette subfamily B protein